VSGLKPQVQTSLLHQQRVKWGLYGSGDSVQPEVVVLGLLGGRLSSANGKFPGNSSTADRIVSSSRRVLFCGSIIVGIGGVTFLYAKATLCGARGGKWYVVGLTIAWSGFRKEFVQILVLHL
jgi:hypothetical protein